MGLYEVYAKFVGYCLLGFALSVLFTNTWWPIFPMGLAIVMVGLLTRRLESM